MGKFSHIHMISVDSKGGAVRQHSRIPRHDLLLAYCRDVYFHPNDNHAVCDCSQAVNLQMVIGHGRNIGT